MNIQSLEKEDLSFEDLKRMMGPKWDAETRFLNWDELANYKLMSELMTKPAVIILLHIEGPHAPSVGHFILLLDFNDHLEHFDSYGLTMEEELAITHEQHLTRIFKTYRKPVINNTKKLQTFRKDINTCGRWIVTRRMLSHLTLDKFLKFISNFHLNPDDLVTAMTTLLQFKT
jgi:hypothetical protein